MILYKYSHLIDGFFELPTLKISQPKYLNDPFESSIATKAHDVLTDITKEKHERFRNTKIERHIAEIICAGDLEDFLSDVGVISLTETHRDLLMWAHYANHHRGMVIGIDDSVFTDSKIDINRTGSIRPFKVNYDSIRLDLESLDFITQLKEEQSNHRERRFIIEKLLTTKSNEWMYEKEHRFILPLHVASYIDVRNKDISNLNNTTLTKYDRAIVNNIKNKDGKIDCYRVTTNTQRGKCKIIEKFNEREYDDASINYILEINPKHVRSIYFGHRVAPSYVLEIRNKISCKDHPLHHVKIEHYEIDDNRFELKTRNSPSGP